MEKYLYDNRILLYNYDDILGIVIFPQKRTFSVGDRVEVDFNNSEIGFEEGKWERPGVFLGIHYFEFKIHYLTDYWGNPIVCCQLAMDCIG